METTALLSRVICKEIVPAVAVVISVVVIVFNWANLPEVVPIHFGLMGQPDGWGPRLVVTPRSI
jgi:hypothetical protein